MNMDLSDFMGLRVCWCALFFGIHFDYFDVWIAIVARTHTHWAKKTKLLVGNIDHRCAYMTITLIKAAIDMWWT